MKSEPDELEEKRMEKIKFNEDVKAVLTIDAKKVGKSLQHEYGIKRLQCAHPHYIGISDVDYWTDHLSYSTSKRNLQNFLLYRVANDFQLFSGVNDADCTEPVMNHFKEILLSLDEVKSVKVGKKISDDEKERVFEVELYDGSIIYLETDTANSIMTDLGNFIRQMIAKVEGLDPKLYWPEYTYFKTYGLNRNMANRILRGFRNYYFYTLIDRMYETLTEVNDRKRLEELEMRAGTVHTLKNMMLVPYGYNCMRGFKLKTYKSNIKINDDYSLTIKDFYEMLEDPHFTIEQLQKRLGNRKCSVESIGFLLKYKEFLL